MQVIAFSIANKRDWRWRIVNYAGEMVEESVREFETIGEAVSAGSVRLREIGTIDHSVRTSPYGSTSYLRRR